MQITRNTLIVTAKGGAIDYITPEGEILFSIAVPPGKHSAAEYLDLCPEGAQIEHSEGVYIVQPRTRLFVQKPETVESGANPDYQPTSADRFARQMRQTLAQMQSDQKRLDARMAALASIERIPTLPAQTAPEPSTGDAPLVE